MIIVVVAKTYKEFRALVLKDVANFGAGSTVFTKDNGKEAIFRSIKDPGYSVRYVWSKEFWQNNDEFGSHRFEILAEAGKKKRPVTRSLVFSIACLTLLAAAVYLGFLR